MSIHEFTTHKYRNIYNEVLCLAGFGFNVKITKKIYLWASLSDYILGFGVYKFHYTNRVHNISKFSSESSLIYPDFEELMVNELFAKIGIQVVLK